MFIGLTPMVRLSKRFTEVIIYHVYCPLKHRYGWPLYELLALFVARNRLVANRHNLLVQVGLLFQVQFIGLDYFSKLLIRELSSSSQRVCCVVKCYFLAHVVSLIAQKVLNK